jgi:hypothetical protein
MATLVENSKNFKVLKMSYSECRSLNWGIPNGIICASCNGIINKDEIHYVCVLHDTLCKSCYKEWLKGAKNYPEDREYEDKIYDNVTEELEKLYYI